MKIKLISIKDMKSRVHEDSPVGEVSAVYVGRVYEKSEFWTLIGKRGTDEWQKVVIIMMNLHV